MEYYVFRFINQTKALNDPIVGPFLGSNNPYDNLTIDQLDFFDFSNFPSYWCIVGSPGGNRILLGHRALQFVFDPNRQSANGAFVVKNNMPYALLGVGIPGIGMTLQGVPVQPLLPGPPPPPPLDFLTDDMGVILTDDAGNGLTVN